MKKILTSILCLLFVSCIDGGFYTGDVVVVGKKSVPYGNAFHESIDYILYGETGKELIRWWVGEIEYNATRVGDTIHLYDTYYREERKKKSVKR